MKQEQAQKTHKASGDGCRSGSQDQSGTVDRDRASRASQRASGASRSAGRFLARTERI